MPILKNSKHERFAQLVANGMKQATAYRKVYRGTANAAKAHGARLVAKGSVATRIRELQENVAAKVEIDKTELVTFCASVIRCNIRDLESDSPLIQSFEQKEFGSKITVPNKLDAVDKIAKLCGFYAPEKKEVAFDDLEAMLHALTHGKA